MAIELKDRSKKRSKNNFFLLRSLCFFVFSIQLWIFWNTPVFAKKAVGWHWYNEIYPIKHKDKKNEKSKKSAMEQMLMLRKTVQEAKAKAILYPTVENMRSYLILQNFVTNQAGLFTQVWKKTLLKYPELDYGILHPTQNSAQHIISAENSKKEKEAISSFSKRYGLFFFYRGNNLLDQALAPIIYSFSKENNISLIPISIDGKLIDVFTKSCANNCQAANNRQIINNGRAIDNGQAEKLGIKHFPALILVDPKSRKVVPINYGFISDSELRRRFLQVATEFKVGV